MIIKNIKKQTYILLLIIFFGFYLFSQNVIDGEVREISQACIKNKCFKVETAVTAQEQKMGLMNREFLALDSGMLFVFEKEDIHNFWMKNTLIPLDIIWIDKDNKVIFIKENAEPCKTEKCELFEPDKKSKYVLEINGGLAEKIGFKIGDEVEYR
ncbi:MAG: DUF192 domain-containing protein [Patescibacteria group bacterium]|nr:DUF192 domain-containing protein [Patescibacteria group bacterium]